MNRSEARHATARWLCHPPFGAGHLHSESRAFEGLPFSLPEEHPNGETTPAELLAAAYAAFISAHVGDQLERDGSPARELIVDVWWAPDGLEVEVRGRVDELGESSFESGVRDALAACVKTLGLTVKARPDLKVILA
jgi:hypothetical protein